MHLSETRLAEADLTADERAHLQSCVHCRLSARRLSAFLDDSGPPVIAQETERYTAVRSLGAGGMSRVVLSFDGRLGREVARKKLRDVRSERDVERFVREARITARLEHPNIVPVYDLEVDALGNPTLTMRVVRGTSLGEAMRTGALPDRRARLEVFLKVCDAVAFAHSRGVVHRDLKPDNVMVGEFGEVQVVDFGLAATEAIEADTPGARSATLTRSGTKMGTPAYMSPEQARGEIEQVGTLSDVYGLGATLWEIATGRPPFVGDSDAVVAEVARGRVPSPRVVDPSVPEDLAAIVLRAMATDPRDRFPDVTALRRDVVSFLGHAPVSARVPTIGDLLAKWLVRNRATVMPVAATAILALLVIMAGLVVWARQATTSAEQRRADLRSSYVSSGRDAYESGDRLGALPFFAGAVALAEGDDHAEEMARIRFATAFRSTPRLVAMLPTELSGGGAALSDDARFAATVDRRPTPAGVVPDDAEVRLWDVASGLQVASSRLGGRGWSVRFSPNSDRIIVASESPAVAGTLHQRHAVLSIFDDGLHLIHGPLETTESSTCYGRRVGFTDGGSVAFVRDSCALLFGAWSVVDGAPVTLATPTGTARPCGASVDGSRVLICDRLRDPEHGSIWLQDRRTGERLGPGIAWGRFGADWDQAPSAEIIAVAFHGSGVVMVDTRSGEIVSTALDHKSGGVGMVSDDGLRVATASRGRAFVSDIRSGAAVPPLWHGDWVMGLGFSPAGSHLATAGSDRLGRVWDLRPRNRPPGAPDDAVTVNVSDDGRLVLAWRRRDETVALYDARTGELLGTPIAMERGVEWSFMMGSNRALIQQKGPNNNSWRLFDLETGRLIEQWSCGSMSSCSGTVTGSNLVLSSDNGLLLVDPDSGRALGPHTASGSVMEVITVPREGQVVALTPVDTRWWDLARGVSLGARLPALSAAAVDPTGTRLAGAERSPLSDDFHGGSAVVMFDLESGARVTTPFVHDAAVLSIAWSADGKRLATGASDGTVIVWDVASGSRLIGPMRVESGPYQMGFSRDERFLVARTGSTIVFDARTGEFVALLDEGAWSKPIPKPDLTFSTWYEEPDRRPAEDLRDAAAVLAVKRMLPTGWVDLPPDEGLTMWRRLHELYPGDFAR